MSELVDISVRMCRSHLNHIPVASLPDGFHFRFYRPGDREAWVLLYDAAESIVDINSEVFDKQFHGDEAALEKRMLFIQSPDGELVATSCAWYDDRDSEEKLGRVHWVAMHPIYQGRGLAKPLLSETLRTLKNCGHESAYLMTSSSRIPALTLYLTYGFVPELRSNKDYEAWKLCVPHLRTDAQSCIRSALAAWDK